MTDRLEDIAGATFDYVVVGGGTTGLTLAARLAEEPHVSVAVLEAGAENLNDPLIKIPAQFGRQLGNPKYDWAFQTTPQKHANNRSILWSRGKMLGGSSAVNFYCWTKPPSQDMDAWEKLGNPGWNWKRFQENAKKVETFTPPKPETAMLYKQVFNPEAHGTSGPLRISFPDLVMAGEMPFYEAVLNSGIKRAKDPLNGDPIGANTATCNLDPRTYTRSYAATAFYEPNKDKSNFRVLCNSLALRIITKPIEEGSDVTASGIEFEYAGKAYNVYARKDVILSAGALKSPQILELSGIGDSSILGPLGIKSVVDLPGVGRNMQEHIFCTMVFELDQNLGYETLDKFADKAFAELQLALHAEGKGMHRLAVSGVTYVPLASVTSTPDVALELVKRQRERIEESIKKGSLSPSLKAQFDLQLEELENGNGGDCEIICFPSYFSGVGSPESGKGYMSIFAILNHPFSRGHTHVISDDPHTQPEMDPKYFEDDFDLNVICEILKFGRRLAETEPFKSIIAKEVVPGPKCATDADMKEHIKDNVSTIYHTAGTLSMLPRSLEGVVGPDLVVHGTKNIRVADISIIPLHVASHTQSVAYAIGEQAADIIRSRT